MVDFKHLRRVNGVFLTWSLHCFYYYVDRNGIIMGYVEAQGQSLKAKVIDGQEMNGK